jgi:hypothetical protein
VSEFPENDEILLDILAKAKKMAGEIGVLMFAPVIRRGPHDNAPYYVEIDSRGLHLVSIDRGFEVQRETTSDPGELLYWILRNETKTLASRFELDHRIEGQDCRRIAFKKQEELLGELKPAWGERCKREHEEILKARPFQGSLGSYSPNG